MRKRPASEHRQHQREDADDDHQHRGAGLDRERPDRQRDHADPDERLLLDAALEGRPSAGVGAIVGCGGLGGDGLSTHTPPVPYSGAISQASFSRFSSSASPPAGAG